MVTNSEWEKIGELPVDSGQMLLGDPAYVLPDEVFEELIKTTDLNTTGALKGYSLVPEKLIRDTMGYKKCLNTYEHPNAAYKIQTGFGDGVYEVFVKRQDHKEFGSRISELKIVFLDENDNAEDVFGEVSK